MLRPTDFTLFTPKNLELLGQQEDATEHEECYSIAVFLDLSLVFHLVISAMLHGLVRHL